MIYNNYDILNKYRDQNGIVNWTRLSHDADISEGFIREYKNDVDWRIISAYQVLSEEFIREFKDKVYWDLISSNQKLSEGFIREFMNKFKLINPWINIMSNQKLSEEFIKEFKDVINWRVISRHQSLSLDFIKEFKDNIALSEVQFNELINNETKAELGLKPIVFKHKCGGRKRTIYVFDNMVKIGCSVYTEEDAIHAISNQYTNSLQREQYIEDIEDIFKEYRSITNKE